MSPYHDPASSSYRRQEVSTDYTPSKPSRPCEEIRRGNLYPMIDCRVLFFTTNYHLPSTNYRCWREPSARFPFWLLQDKSELQACLR